MIEAATSAPWYDIAGPKVTASYDTSAGIIELRYVPLNEFYKNAHDAYFSWKLPSLQKVDVELAVEHSEKRGAGGGTKTTLHSKSADFLFRYEAFQNGTIYGEGKLNSKHLDLSAGVITENKIIQPYGYFTLNSGKWDDTLTFGWGPEDRLWNAFSTERSNYGIISINYWQPKTTDYTAWAYLGKSDVNKNWFTRNIDRILAYNDIDPKERSLVLRFPSYLSFAKWTGELRADRTKDKSFFNAGFGRTFKPKKLKGIKFGFGTGIEYEKKPENVIWQPNGEAYLEIPFGKHSFALTKRFRRNEGNIYVSFNY